MKAKTISTIVLVTSQLLFAVPSALANTITYTAPTSDRPGKFSGELPVNRIAAVKLPDGVVKFNDDEMIVEAVPDWLFDREEVLKGTIVRAELGAQKTTSVLAGLVFFMDGQWLTSLGPRRTVDDIALASGNHVRGRIVSRSGQAFVVQPEVGGVQKVSFADIKSIVSPRAFSFNIPTPTARISPTDTTLTVESNLIQLAPSAPQTRFWKKSPEVPKTTLAGTDPGVSKGAMATYLTLDLISEISPAISIPLVLNKSTQNHALKVISDSLNQSLGLNNSSSTAASGSSSGSGM